MGTPPKVDYAKQSPERLRDLRRRYEEQGHLDLSKAILDELERRGLARRPDFSSLKWNQDAVRETLAPFAHIAKFPGNLRTSYTEAGGRKIGRSKNDPERMWIDSYSAMKTQKANYVFVCYIAQAGEDPEFRLIHNDVTIHTYNAEGLDEALQRWGRIRDEISQN